MISPLKVSSNLIAKRATLLLGVSVPLRDFRGDKHFSKSYGWVCVNTSQRSLQTYRGNLTIVYSSNLSEISDYHLFFKLVRDIYHLFSKLVRKDLTAVYSPSKAEKADSVFHNFGEELDREKSDGAFGSERFVTEASGRRVWSYVSRAPSNYLDLNPERADGVAISTHSSAVTLNGFRVLNASGAAIPFHR